jgi:hypothetical protein
MTMITKYQKRISGPIFDRIDIHLDVHHEPMQKLPTLDSGEPSSVIRTRVEAARQKPTRDRGTSACPHPADCCDHPNAWVDLGDGEQVRLVAESTEYPKGLLIATTSIGARAIPTPSPAPTRA